MAKQPRVWSGTQWEPLAVTLPDLSNYSTTSQMNTAIDNAKGMVHISTVSLSGNSTYDITNCFSSTYNNYRLIFNATSGNPAAVRLQLLNGTTPNTDAAYTLGLVGYNQVGSNVPLNQSNATYLHWCNMAATPYSINVYSDISNPFLAQHTAFTILSTDEDSWFQGRAGGGRHNVASSFNGVRFLSSGGNFGATVRIYGYRNS